MADARACDCKHPDTVSVDPRTHGGYPFQCKVCGVNFSHRALLPEAEAKLHPLPFGIPAEKWSGENGYSADQMRQFWEAGRRAGLEEAAKEAEHWQKIGQNPGHKCGEYIAGAIRAQDKHQPMPGASDLPVGKMLARGGCTETKWNMRRNSLMDGEYLLYAVRTTR